MGDASRLWSRLEVRGECWEWTGAQSGTGGRYGRIKWEGRLWLPHRLAFLLHNGVDPGQLKVMHSCDNPLCCRPDHLTLGTNSLNMIDARDKGRLRQAEMVACTCRQCGVGFQRPAHRVKSNNEKQGKLGPFCGRRCAALGSKPRQGE